MSCKVVYTPRAVEDLKGLSRPARALVYGWISKNLAGCDDPRRCGSGEPEGGRWRYCIGEYRLIAEIEEERIVILAVNTGLGLKGSGKGQPPNVFLRSALRQPVKTGLLLLIMALLTFAFVSRASEYLLIRQETERLAGYYDAVGYLKSNWRDTGEAAAYLEAREDVETVNTYRYVPGLLQEDFGNGDYIIAGRHAKYFTFYGILTGWGENPLTGNLEIRFTVDTVLSGSSDFISEGQNVNLFGYQYAGVKDVGAAFEELEIGKRYLALGYFDPFQALINSGGPDESYISILFVSVSEDSFFLPVPAGQEADWSTPGLHQWIPDVIRLSQEDFHSMNMVAVKDMTILPELQREEPEIFLTEGRWLDSTDDEAGRSACLISAWFASARDLSVGDTIHVQLRDLENTYMGYFWEWQDREDRDMEAWAQHEGAERVEETFEIVGIYDYTKPTSSLRVNNIYIPSSVVPDTFTHSTIGGMDEETFSRVVRQYADNMMPLPGQISFSLTSPEAAARFMAETRDDLAAMGFEAELWENGWEAFQAAARPMRQSSLYNALIFSGILLSAVCLSVFLYFRMRRRDVAIARAMGVPARRCAWESSLPMLLAGAAGIGAGGWLGWRYTLDNAGETLRALGEFGGEAAADLPWLWLAAQWGAVLVLLAAVTVGGGAYLASRPVLTLLQGGAAVKEKRAAAQAETAAVPSPGVPEKIQAPGRDRPAAQASGTGGASAAAHVLRFVWRYVTRSRLKSALSILLAAGFMVGLAAIQISIAGNQEKIDRLYENTRVEAELVLADGTRAVRNAGFVRSATVRALLDTGYVTDVYLEGTTRGAISRYSPDAAGKLSPHINDKSAENRIIRGVGDEETFLSRAGSGSSVTITYFDGWDGSLFARDWAEDERFPVVIHKSLYDAFDLKEGDCVGISCRGYHVCDVAGYYEGSTSGGQFDTDPALIPLSAYWEMSGGRVPYSKVHVTLDPALNRDLETFHDILAQAAAGQSGLVALRAVIWDEELRNAVAPLENSVRLMQVLYPVTLALSLLVAAGIAALFVMTSAKEAAILRVLGTTRLRSQIMLTLQTGVTNGGGLLLGLGGVLAYAGRARPELLPGLIGASSLCALLYLLAAIAGAAVSASAVTAKNPLELLQVRE